MALKQSHVVEKVANMLLKPEHSFQEESIMIKIGLQNHKVHKEGKLYISL